MACKAMRKIPGDSLMSATLGLALILGVVSLLGGTIAWLLH